MTRIRNYGSWTAVLNDENKTISIRQKRPESNSTVIPGHAGREKAISEMGLEEEIDNQGYVIVDELTE